MAARARADHTNACSEGNSRTSTGNSRKIFRTAPSAPCTSTSAPSNLLARLGMQHSRHRGTTARGWKLARRVQPAPVRRTRCRMADDKAARRAHARELHSTPARPSEPSSRRRHSARMRLGSRRWQRQPRRWERRRCARDQLCHLSKAEGSAATCRPTARAAFVLKYRGVCATPRACLRISRGARIRTAGIFGDR